MFVMALKMFQEKAFHPFETIGSVIAVAAGKGGVGKSTVSVNLALALHQMGYRVGIMDTDIYGPSVRRMLPENRMPAKRGERIVPAVCSGIKMISMAYFRKEEEASVVRAPIANGVIKQFIQQVDWGELDFLIIDFPPGTGDIQLTLAQQGSLTGAVMVTTPQEISMMDVKKAMNMFDQVKVPVIGIVENMSYYLKGDEKIYLFGKGGGERLARGQGLPFLGGIPILEGISRCSDRGESIFSLESSEAAEAYLSLARGVDSHLETLAQSSEGCLKNFELLWK
jgi:ATP-binding protein involved in chromosome partitioning